MVEKIPTDAEVIAAARGWALDCEWQDRDEIPQLSDADILRGVNAYYCGGLVQFVADMT